MARTKSMPGATWSRAVARRSRARRSWPRSRAVSSASDESKLVKVLGAFPLPVEVIPMATARLVRQFAALGGTARVRLKDGAALVTDNGQHILDVTGLQIADPLAFESQIGR